MGSKSWLGFSLGQVTTTQNSWWNTNPYAATDASACLKERQQSQAPCWTNYGGTAHPHPLPGLGEPSLLSSTGTRFLDNPPGPSSNPLCPVLPSRPG